MTKGIIATETTLPVNYEIAKRAITECERIDEVKEWKDRAAAIASYAAQKRDRTLVDKATRIRARATRRLGELLETHAKAKKITLQKAARECGVRASESSTARNVARVERDTFERVVEKTPPMPISNIGRLAQGRYGSDESEKIWKVLDRLGAVMREFPSRSVVESIAATDPREALAIKTALGKAVDYLDTIVHAAEKRL